MAIRRFEINALTGSITGTAAADGNYVFPLDTSKYSGTVTYYFEVVYSGAASNTGSIRLRRKGTTTDDATITGATSATIVLTRSASFTPPSNTLTEYVVRNNADGTRSQTIKAARIIVIQDDGGTLTSCQHQFEIGNTETAKVNITASALTSPKYWKYESANYDGSTVFYAEITWTLTGTGTGTVVLQESSATLTAPTWTDKVTIVSAGTAATPTRVRSIAFTPTDGRMYRITTVNSSSMGALSIYNAKIVVDQAQGFTSYESQTLGVNSQGITYGSGGINEEAGQTIIPASTFNIAKIEAFINKNNSPTDNLVMKIYSDAFGGTVLATSDTIAATSITTNTYVAFTFSSSPTLTSGSTYYFALSRSGARDTVNYCVWLAQSTDVVTGNAAVKDSGVWSNVTGKDLRYITYSQDVAITKFEEHYLLANTALAAGTALQNFLSKWDSADWSGVTNTYIHQAEASDGNTSVVEVDTAAGVQVTGSVVTSPDNLGQSSSMTMPANGNLDVKATTNSGSIFGSRIIVKSVKSVVASIPNKIYSIKQSVNRASTY